MKLSHPSRLIAGLVAIFSLLFMQFAVAAYACPGLAAGQNNSVEMLVSAGDRDMPGCIGMDDVQPNLCQAYDQAGNQSLDKPELPNVQPFNAASFVLAVSFIYPVPRPIVNQSDSFFLRYAAAPPLSIRNCCLRI